MSVFMEIIAIQPPIDIGVDANNRAMFSTNYRASLSLHTNSIELELIKYLNSIKDQNGNGVATLRVGLTGDTVYGSKGQIPSGPGPWILVKLTGGYSPRSTHSDEYETNVTFSVATYASSGDVSSAKAWQIYDALNGKRDIEVNL